MRKLIFLTLSLLIFQHLHAQRYAVHLRDSELKASLYRADSLYFCGNLDESIKLYHHIREKTNYSHNLTLNLATMYAEKGDLTKSADNIVTALDSGFMDLQYFTANPSFDKLRANDIWKTIVIKHQERVSSMLIVESIKFPNLALSILSMGNQDQLAQWKSELKNNHLHAYPDLSMDSVSREQKKVFEANTEILKGLFSLYGFLWEKDLGIDATHVVWMMVQHADHDTKFQMRYLKEMKAAIDRGAVVANKKDYAYMYDRVAKNTGNPQRYGTQVEYRVKTIDNTNKKQIEIVPYLLENEDDLDKLRTEFGLPTWSEYLLMIRQLSGQ
ncbi:DUF6624 domain-containing protein [Sphingobacterium corticis]|uniref:DUF6624 domain-containing protein n=1 Tax=Sphingobacterium corticis TaxID=1812823 RepID=A0ABW5NI18_9SPHI